MQDITTVGVDLEKEVFAVCVLDQTGAQDSGGDCQPTCAHDLGDAGQRRALRPGCVAAPQHVNEL